MPDANPLTDKERSDIEALIQEFDNHGCGFGLDVKAWVALRRLLGVLEQAERTIERCRALAPD
jgi:hypothetical protein